MKKHLLLSLLSVLLLVFGNPVVGWGQGTETFGNQPTASSTSYISRSWTGDDGSTWTATKTRTDQTINGKAACMNDDEADTYVESGTISGGIGDLTITTQRKYSGGSGNLNVSVNGSNVGTVPYSGSVQTTTLTGVNVAGNVVIRIDNNIGGSNGGGADRVAIDDVTWTAFTATTDTRVNFTTATSTVAEDGLFIDVCASITNPSATVATTVDINLTGGTATNGTDYDDGAGTPAAINFPQTLTFPMGSSADQCFTIYISVNDTDIEGDETIELVLENAGGGTNADVGTETTHTVTITDNDAPPVCLTEGFEGGSSAPAGWDENSVSFSSSASNANTGTRYANLNSTSDWLITSQLTNPYELTFFARASWTTSNYTIDIDYATSPTGPWTTFTSLNANGSNTGDIIYTYQEFTATLNLTGLYYIRWNMSARSSGSFYLDDVEVNCTPSAPSNCSGTMSGTYTIDASQPASCTNYQDFASAISDMVSGTRADDYAYRHDGGISGAVVFEVATDIYTEQISIDEIPGASATNTVTFQSASGTNTDVVLQHPSSSTFGDPDYVLQLNGCDYVTFQNITIQRTGTNDYFRVVDVSGNASYNAITGNILTGDVAASPHSSRSQVVYSDDANTGNTHNTISNNTIRGGYHGIYWQGTSSNTESDLTVSGNNIASYRYGMYLRYIDDMTISGNTITTPTQFNSSSTEGIYCFNADGQLDITGNTVTLTGGSSNTGIELSACAGSGSAVGDISNNMVIVGGTGTSEGITSGSTTSYKNYYYNSCYTTGSNATSARAFYMNGSNNINIRNNAFVATVGNAIEIQTTSGVLNSDYNLLYSTGSYVGYWSGNRATLADYRIASGGDANSISADPGFISATDLHVNPGSPTDAAATPGLGITTDIDGETRHATTPDIGADEYNNTLPIVTLAASANTGSEAAQTVITLTATASMPVTGDQTSNVAVSGTGITAGDYTLSATTITIPNGSTSGSVTFTIIDDILDEGDETATVTISHPSSGGYVIGSPDSQDILIEDNDAPTCYELMISEYHEDGNEKYIEIYNPTANAISLTPYSLKLYANGATSPNNTDNLTGTIAAYSTVVYKGSSASDYAGTATSSAACSFNGNDAIALDKSGTNIDVIGTIGNSSYWGDDLVIRRNADVEAPNTTYTASEWTSPGNTINVSDLGQHTSDCFVSLPVVTLSTNTTTGTETAQTEIILTATADVAVTGDQTVVVALGGTGVTATDFTNVDFTTTVNIPILDGETTGTLTFNVADDTDVEGTETATFTIGSPSSGIVVGTPNQVSVTIDDNDNVTSTESVIIEQDGEATGISSLSNGIITNNTQGTQVWAFNLHDGNGTNDDTDSKPTIYEQWVLRPGTGNTVPDWNAAINNVKFFLGASTTPIPGSFLVNPASISFLPSSPITVADGTTPAEIFMRITLNNSLPPGSDGQHFVFSLDDSDVTVESGVLLSSQLGTFTQQSDAALNGIDITATLQFIDAPTAVSVGSNFSVTVSAIDANGNVDTGVSNSITLSLTSGSGTLTGAPVIANLVNGTYTFTGLSHDSEEVIEITVHDNNNVFADLTANITVTDEPHQLFDDFNRANNDVVGVPSSETVSTYSETGTGNGSRSRIEDNQLLLANCNNGSGSGGSNGMEQVMFNVENRHETVFDDAGSTLEWIFNMQQTRSSSDPSGFGSNTYASGVILGSNQQNVEAAGANGYAVIIGNSGDPDPVKLVRFANGLSNNNNVDDVAVSSETNYNDHFSIKVTYDPCNGEWELYVRSDGNSFASPNVGSLGTAVTGTDQTHTALDLKYFGYIWQHGVSCTETASFDNINIPNATSATTTAKVWNGSVNANWNEADNWGPCPGVPTITDDVEIPNVATQPIISAATPVAVCNNLTIEAGATLTINSAIELTADGDVTNNGTVTVENNGSFIQTQNGTAAHAGSGNFVVKRNATSGYHGWSTPVIGGIRPGNNGFSYNSALGTSDPSDDNNPNPDPGWVHHSGAMVSGKGYFADNVATATFTGKANNGDVSIGITQETAATPDLPGTRYNLVGNPYPSAIDADQFITDNGGQIDGSIYLWDDDNTGSANYTLNDYATYTLAGGIPTIGGSNGTGPIPAGKIASAQGFFVSCTNSGNLTFTNAQRGGSNTQFFRMAAPTTQRLWLSINNDNLDLFNQTLVAFDELATDQKDWGVDAIKFRGNQRISIGAQQDNETYAIATYASIPASGKIIPLMTYVETAGTYTFAADSLEGFENHNVFLEDLSNGTLYPLTQGDAYSFNLSSADEYNRFQLWFSPMVVTGIEDEQVAFFMYATQNNVIVVETNSTETVQGTLQITDMAGRLVQSSALEMTNGIGKIYTQGIANGVYAITFVTADGNIITSQKVALSR